MALPKPVDAAKVQVVSEAIGKMSPQEIGGLPSLADDDFRLFGAISQHYCFLDLNLRRALEIMHLAKRLTPEHVKKYPNYTDASLTDVLRGSVEKMAPDVENLEETLFRLEEIGRCRTYRNLLAHFAGKRYPNEDVYVFASKSDKDARQVLGKELAGHRVHFSIAGRSELFELEKLLNGHQEWLSKKIPEWDARYLKGQAAEDTMNEPNTE
jgi:hypothetical protein